MDSFHFFLYLRLQKTREMSILLYILLGALTFISLIALIGLFLPQQVKVERSIIIEAEPAIIFDEIADFENFVTWNTWTKKDPAIKQWFEGEKFSVGSKYSWEGNKKVGKGSMEITHIEANRRVNLDMNFGPSGVANCGFILEPIDEKTKVTWYFNSDMGRNPLTKLIGPMMDKFIGKDYSEGLKNLAEKITNFTEKTEQN